MATRKMALVNDPIQPLPRILVNDIELVTFLEWTKYKYYEKKPTFCSGDEAAIKLRDKLKKLKQHYYIKMIQSQ